MNLKVFLREWLGDEWGKMLGIFVILSFAPICMLLMGEYAFCAKFSAILLAPFFAYVLARHHWGATAVHKVIETAWGIAALLLLASIGLYGAHLAFEKWYPHTSSTLVYTNGNWMQGEQRTCSLNTSREPYELDCTVKQSPAEPHQFNVTYTGEDPAVLPKERIHTWMCTRGAESISCENGN